MRLLELAEHAVKKPVFGCRMCGACVLHSTGMTCPMTCPKTLRNGPCGGVRENGHCEVVPEMRCVWVNAEERSAHASADARELARGAEPPASAARQPAAGKLVVEEPRERPRPADTGRLDDGAARVSAILRALCEDRSRPIVTAELPSVDSGGLDEVRRHAEPLRGFVDAINATDNPAAHAHASNTSIAIALERLGIEPVLQVVCRDKNRLALQADILGAALHGVVNVACLTGDDVTAGDEPEARRVFDVDGPQLVSIARGPAQRQHALGPPARPGARPLPRRGREPRRAAARPSARCVPPRRSRPARASCSCRSPTAPTSSRPSSRPAARSASRARCALLPTICLVSGERALRFMDEQVPGISVPAATIERVATSSSTPARRPTSSASSRRATRSRCPASQAST